MNSSDIFTCIIFYLCAANVIFSSIFTILSKRIMHSLLFAVILFFTIGIIFLFLSAEYNAIIQIAVYGVAIPILFVLAIMFTSHKVDKNIYLSFTPRFIFTVVAAILFILTLFNILLISSSVIEWLFTPQSVISINRYEIFKAISDGLYVKFLLSFEMIALLALSVIVGLSSLNIFKGARNG